MTPFERMFQHTDDCPKCRLASKGMCPEGVRLLELASTHTAEAMAPMPPTPGKA